jgi:hypothetical protein
MALARLLSVSQAYIANKCGRRIERACKVQVIPSSGIHISIAKGNQKHGVLLPVIDGEDEPFIFFGARLHDLMIP